MIAMSKIIRPRVAVFIATAIALVIGISFAANRSSRLFSVDADATEMAINSHPGQALSDKDLSQDTSLADVQTFYEAIANRKAADDKAAGQGEPLIARSIDDDNAISG